MKLTPAMEKFVVHWGEMGTKWGINRTVAQIHALLYVTGKLLNAEEIAETLGVARSNVSTGLRELQSWGIIKASQVLGDRRDHFDTHHDLWVLFQTIMDERKKREIDPTIAVLRQCVAEAEKEADAAVRKRLADLSEFVEAMAGWYTQVRRLPPTGWRRLAKMGNFVQKIVGK